MTIGKVLNLLKYTKQKIKKTPRYQLTQRVKKYFAENKNTNLSEDERTKLLKFLSFNLVEIFNYSFVANYHFRKTPVLDDKSKGLSYVVTDQGRKLYFKRGLSHSTIRTNYNTLCLEQDKNSPHNYYYNNFKAATHTILADIGSAEGNFSLSIVDQVKHIYLFECEDPWIEALEATFEPWKEKITIVKKYVSDESNRDCVRLDDYFEDKEKPTLFKIDVEGAERRVLNGGKKTLIDDSVEKILLCTYHKTGDFEEFSKWMNRSGFNFVSPPGYIFFHLENPNYSSVAPFDFRKGLIIGTKK
ncbi:MAG: FkbM family methyltransferase [Bacteroidales bacterium]|nr:FkbM family methyltransferase [Bacteroidales bacterium]